ncbi:MAG TPA: glycoside hydrolase family 31 protein [Chitinispirillaceae bacterium]|nr:glycoside hydrolase family 31 protein [Chitinispirillaceae bacterium]
MKKVLLSFGKRICMFLLIGTGVTTAETITSFSKESDGALCVLSNNARLKLQVCNDHIVRVVYTMGNSIPAAKSLVVVRETFTPGTWDASENATSVTVTTSKVTATVNKSTGRIAFAASGSTICTENDRTLTAVTKGGTAGYSGTLKFDSPSNEGVYGLGNLSMAKGGWDGKSYWDDTQIAPDKAGQLNIRNFTVDMHQVNWMDVIPFFMTTSGYGILMNFGCHASKKPGLDFTADFLLNGSWDYYFIYGPEFDTIISEYRYLTGPAPLPPKWAFGFWQCKNRYASSAEIITAIQTYRSQKLPIDCIVQDWMWWAGGENGRGSFAWDLQFANPQNWIKTVHENNAHLALSIWPTFATGTSNYTAMQPHLITTVACNGTNTNPGVFMNAWDTTGLRKFWDLMKSSAYDAGVDAWWMDATEPECEYLGGFNTSFGISDLYSNTYALMLAKNIYERQRAVSSSKRVVNLTRSFWAGQQRYGTLYWNGDISSKDIKNVATTVAGGINSCMAGNPYWCSDIGGFMDTLKDETLIRWFQAGTFFPIFRIHGSRNTEIYAMSETARPIATEFSKLRYRLMPYIYSLGWKVTNEGYTMTRALPFDFPGDVNIRNIADQFMFGPSLLINPVVTSGATSRSVYLPGGTWYDFWTGTANNGNAGRTENATAPLQRIPIYAREGAILPMGPEIQYATERSDTIELRVYPGKNGSFTLYEDEGDNYNYENGKYAEIPITYIDNDKNVIIGSRKGSFDGMGATKVFNVVFVKENHGIGPVPASNPDYQLTYTGSQVSCIPIGVAAGVDRAAAQPGMLMTVQTINKNYVFPRKFRGVQKEVSLFDCSGKLLKNFFTRNNTININSHVNIANRVIILRVSVVR